MAFHKCILLSYWITHHTTCQVVKHQCVSIRHLWGIWVEYISRSSFPENPLSSHYIDAQPISKMEVTTENSSASNIASAQPSPAPMLTYADFLRTIANEYPKFSVTLKRLEGDISPSGKAMGVIFGAISSILALVVSWIVIPGRRIRWAILLKGGYPRHENPYHLYWV